jgi:beta-galactosidase
MMHGGDYNPDQWLHEPKVLEEDIRLMKLAGCNAMSVGIFAWSALEPVEGRYELGWLDAVLDRFRGNGIYTILATPSGARPPWLAAAYPEVLRVRPDGGRNLFGNRHNHCFTSPVYREKVAAVNQVLARRYGNDPTVVLWHLSNEYSGDCHCELCREAFRAWLAERYGNDLDRLNHAWWAAFWSHTYTTWSQIHPPSTSGDSAVHGHKLDWRRFVTHQTADFMRGEIAAVRSASDLPVTANLMGTFDGLDYFALARDLDVVSWDSYPSWHGRGTIPNPRGAWDAEGRDWRLASDIAFVHDLNRSLKAGRPFMLMESTPSVTNWHSVAKLKRPGMHLLSSLQAVAHGSDTVQYFQWRKSRGSAEKFHGAVVDHVGHEQTRVFRDVSEVGGALAQMDDVLGTSVPARVALLFDWENRWALEDAEGPLNDGRKAYERTCKDHYEPFWRRGIAVDVINEDGDFSPYRLVVAPMLYMVRRGVAERLDAFVRAGGTLLVTYWSGIVDESDLCYLGGFPGPLRKLLGIWSEEIDALYPGEENALVMSPQNSLGLSQRYPVSDLCDLVHAEGAEILATYGEDFYKGRPALTVNRTGSGKAYYLAARAAMTFLDDLTERLVTDLSLERAVPGPLPLGVSACLREDQKNRFLFLLNFTKERHRVSLASGRWRDVLGGGDPGGTATLEPYGVRVYRRGV